MRRTAAFIWVLFAAAGCGGRAPAPAELDAPLDAAALRVPARVERDDGDWILANGFLTASVSALDAPRGFPLSGGNLTGLAPAGGVSGVRELFTYLDDTFPRQAVYESLAPDPAESTAAVLVARGRDSENPALAVETRYRLETGSPWLTIVTTVTNHGPHRIEGFELGDAVQWGRVTPFAPGPGVALRGTNPRIPWLGAGGEGSGYVIAGDDSLSGPQGGSWSDPIYAVADLDPGAAATYRRRVFVARGSVSEAAHRWMEAVDAPHGVIEIHVRDDAGHGVSGAVVEARRGTRSELLAETDASGDALLRLPPGTYRVDAFHPARGHAHVDGITLRKDASVRKDLRLPAPARITLRASGPGGAPGPAKWTIVGSGSTPDPRLGPEWANPGANVVLTPGGGGTVTVPPGSYRVFASRGPGFEVWERGITVASGDSTAWNAVLTPVPGASAWRAVDLHVHALPSPDSNVSPADRVASAACEGLDWIVSADHGVRAAYPESTGPTRVLVGEEVTTPAWGHFTAFPLPPAPVSPVDRRGDPRDILAALKADAPGGLVMMNHPRSRGDGYFARLQRSGEPLSIAGAAEGFDLIEVANGKRPRETETVLEDWYSLLRDGLRPVGVGNSDSHGLAQDPPGYPRTLVDCPAGDADSLIAALREGRVVVSNGPFIRAAIRGRGPGSIVESSGTDFELDLEVSAPLWVDVSRVTVLVSGTVEKVFPVRERDRAVRFQETVALRLDGSAFVQVRVDGEEFRAPAAPEDCGKPFAVTNPIWVEIPRASR